MLKFIKANLKQIGIILGIAAVCISGAIGYNFFNASQRGAESSVDGSSYGLPANVTLSTPIMYDFVNGSLGLNEDYVDMVDGGKAFIAVNDTRPDEASVFVAYLHQNPGDGAYRKNIDRLLPMFSQAPYRYQFDNKEQKQQFLDYVKNYRENYADNSEIYEMVPETQVVKEGDYTFYIADYGVVEGNNRDLFDDRKLSRNKGAMQTAIDNGMGIPTYIIREKCDLEVLKSCSTRTDFTHSFWDNNNYKERLKCYKKGSTTDYIVLSPDFTHETSSSKEWFPTYAMNGAVWSPGGSLEQIDQMLADHGFESINETLSRGEYAKDTKGTVELFS